MTDLSFSIDGKSTEEIARYFGVNPETVQKAINEGASTYEDVYRVIRREE